MQNFVSMAEPLLIIKITSFLVCDLPQYSVSKYLFPRVAINKVCKLVYPNLYLTLLWTDCRCCWRFCFRVALWPHCVQIYWTPIWTDRTCCWRFVSELSCSHITHKFIWLHCEQIAHVHVDFGFELPYTHNAHKYNYLGHNLIYPWIMVWNWLH